MKFFCRTIAILLILITPALAGTTLFESTWSNSTGTSCAAITDGGTTPGSGFDDDASQYNMSSPSPCVYHYSLQGLLEVYPDGPGGFNYLGISVNGDTAVSFVERADILNQTGDYTYMCAYLRTLSGVSGSGTDYHFIEDQHNDAINWYFSFGASGTADMRFHTWSSRQHYTGGNCMYDYYNGGCFVWSNIDFDTWYRVELQIAWIDGAVSDARSITHVRIYNASTGVLLADDDDILTKGNGDGDPSYTLAYHYSLGRYFCWDRTRDDIKVGNNGPASNTRVGHFIDTTGLKITSSASSDDWIGDWLGAAGGGGSINVLSNGVISAGVTQK